MSQDPFELADACEECADLAEVLRESLVEDYADAPPDAMEDALFDMLDSLTPAEAVGFTKAFRTIQGAARVLDDPTLRQVAVTALPIAGSAVGTAVGGPVGTVVGGALAKQAAGTLAPPPNPARPAAAKQAVAAGPRSAVKGLAATQNEKVLRALVRLALGERGGQTVDGVPVGDVMRMVSGIFAEAAEDADALAAASSRAPPYGQDAEGGADGLYATLIDADNERLEWEVGQG